MEWAINYEKHRDIIRREIVDIESSVDEYDLKINYQEKNKFILVMPVLANIEDLRLKLKEGKSVTIITINSMQNLDFLIANWNGLIDFPEFTIIFMNPFSLTDKRWMIRPHVHNKITENNALRKGLNTMFGTVALITEEEFLEKIKK